MPLAVVDAESGPGVDVGSGLSDLLRIQAVNKCVDNVLQLLKALLGGMRLGLRLIHKTLQIPSGHDRNSHVCLIT